MNSYNVTEDPTTHVNDCSGEEEAFYAEFEVTEDRRLVLSSGQRFDLFRICDWMITHIF